MSDKVVIGHRIIQGRKVPVTTSTGLTWDQISDRAAEPVAEAIAAMIPRRAANVMAEQVGRTAQVERRKVDVA